MFLDELKSVAKPTNLGEELKKEREQAFTELIDFFAELEYKMLKQKILSSAQKGNFITENSKKVIYDSYDISGHYKIVNQDYSSSNDWLYEIEHTELDQKYFELNKKLLLHGETPLFIEEIDFLRLHPKIKKEKITKSYTNGFIIKRHYDIPYECYSFEFTQDTILFLKKINQLALKDGVELLNSTICYRYFDNDGDDGKPIFLEFDNLYTTSKKIEHTHSNYGEFEIADLNGKRLYDFASNKSTIRIKYRVQF